MSWRLGFVGAGVMAEVMIAGLLEQRLLPPERILASSRRSKRSDELARRYGVRTTTSNLDVARTCELTVLSVKPQTLPGVMRELKGQIPVESLVLSIVAGARMAVIREGLAHDKVARCMPNLPCRIRKGMSVWAAPGDASDEDLERVAALLGVMGEEIRVDDEGHVDRATAVNGTGPAIVAAFVKAMLEAATYIGEPRNVAHDTVLATLIGTAEMVRLAGREGVHVAQLMDEVTSPGGTTSRALQVLKKGRFDACITESVEAAYERTLELGRGLEVTVDE